MNELDGDRCEESHVEKAEAHLNEEENADSEREDSA
jgi:hypothetical protein